MMSLKDLTILIPESRELDLFANMLAAEGAAPARCPLVRIADLEDTVEAQSWIDQAISSPLDDLIFLTGEGVRKLAHTPIAAVGPVMEKALADRGLQSVIVPSASFHLKPLVRAIMAWRAR